MSLNELIVTKGKTDRGIEVRLELILRNEEKRAMRHAPPCPTCRIGWMAQRQVRLGYWWRWSCCGRRDEKGGHE